MSNSRSDNFIESLMRSKNSEYKNQMQMFTSIAKVAFCLAILGILLWIAIEIHRYVDIQLKNNMSIQQPMGCKTN